MGTAKDIGVHLAKDEKGCKAQIAAIKAEEILRASLAEASYRVHLENLKHKKGVQEDVGFDLAIIDNEQRGFTEPSDSPFSSKIKKNQKGNKRKKKK
jgi:hypothetical protein